MELANSKSENSRSIEIDEGVVPKVETIKEEENFLKINDECLREWTENVAVDVKRESIKIYDDDEASNESDYDSSDCFSDIVGNDEGKEIPGAINTFMKRCKKKENDEVIQKLCQDATVSEKVTSLCTFKCPNCGKELPSWQQLARHTKICSSESRISISQVAKLISKKVCHVCKLCSRQVLCDPAFLNRHYSSKHKMSTKQYTQKFGIDTSKKFVLSTRRYSNKIVGNLCVYTCANCKKEYDSWHKFNVHQKKFSHGNVTFKNRHLVWHSVYHICRLCDTTILCEKKALTKHLKRCHGIYLKEYCTKTGCEIHEKEDTSLLKKLELSENIDNLCVFSCKICNQISHSSNAFYNHRLRTGHNANTYQSVTKFLIKGSSYKCKVCSKLLLCDKKLIFSHMKDAHQVKADLKGPTTRDKQYKQYCDDFMKDIPESSTIPYSITVPIKEICLQEVTSAMGNLCMFSCPKCDNEVFNNYSVLLYHFKQVHKRIPRYSPAMVNITRYHSCLMCPKAILCDRHFMRSHIEHVHNMSIPKYEAVFSKHGGKVLPTFGVWLQREKEWNS